MRTLVVWNIDSIAIFVKVTRITKSVLVKVSLGWVGHLRTVVLLVYKAVTVVVLIRTSIAFNVVFRG